MQNNKYIELSHQSGRGSKIKKKYPKCLVTFKVALSYHYKFKNVLMSPFGDINNKK